MIAAEGMKRTDTSLRGALLDAAEGVASEAGGLLHHFRTKDRLIEALVMRAAEGWRAEWVFPTMCRRARVDNARSVEALPFRCQVVNGAAAPQFVGSLCGGGAKSLLDRADVRRLERPPSSRLGRRLASGSRRGCHHRD
jgi:AcrR family transcriptional regulator